jgi:hypothetical protein
VPYDLDVLDRDYRLDMRRPPLKSESASQDSESIAVRLVGAERLEALECLVGAELRATSTTQ